MTTSRLETIKIWGCWSLRWLPPIRMYYSSRPAVIEVEKDVWDALEWMGCQPVITPFPLPRTRAFALLQKAHAQAHCPKVCTCHTSLLTLNLG
jgi:hypothetical protein